MGNSLEFVIWYVSLSLEIWSLVYLQIFVCWYFISFPSGIPVTGMLRVNDSFSQVPELGSFPWLSLFFFLHPSGSNDFYCCVFKFTHSFVISNLWLNLASEFYFRHFIFHFLNLHFFYSFFFPLTEKSKHIGPYIPGHS